MLRDFRSSLSDKTHHQAFHNKTLVAAVNRSTIVLPLDFLKFQLEVMRFITGSVHEFSLLSHHFDRGDITFIEARGICRFFHLPIMSYRKTKFLKVLEPIKKGAYFYFTIPYGIFYICGAIAGYVRDKSNLCLGVSGSIGVVFVLLGELLPLYIELSRIFPLYF